MSVESTLQDLHQKSIMGSYRGDDFEKSDVDINQENVKLILMDGFEYSFSRMVDESLQKWKCTNKSCYAYFKIMDNRLLPGLMAHTHPRNQFANEVKKEPGPEEQVQSPVVQRGGGLQAKRIYPSQEKSDLPQSWNQAASSAGGKKLKLVSEKALPNPGASSPSSGSVSDQDLLAFQLATSPAKSPSKSPKLSEIGPPPTPPLSRNSSLHEAEPSSPLPPIIDLVEATHCTPPPTNQHSSWYRPPSFSPDFSAHFTKPSTERNAPPRMSPAKPSPPLSCGSQKQSKLTKYKEFENKIMQLNNETFGFAVTSLLSELPTETAESMRYEIATLLFGAVEGHANSLQTN